MYSAKIILDSINDTKDRLTTFELTYPRFVHAELLTHRLFSRNSASSRALPTKKLLEQIRANPVMPKWWGRNQSGMQAKVELAGWRLELVKRVWLGARYPAMWTSRLLNRIGLHKQIANRVLEPWMFITVIVSATEYENWYYLRDSEFAQPEIAWVAEKMRECHRESTPIKSVEGAWHLPYIELVDEDSPLYVDLTELANALGVSKSDQEVVQNALVMISTARCARVSYLTHDGKRDYTKDIELHERCRDNGHWSAFEHCAVALHGSIRSGNFVGWRQYRKTFENEHAGRGLPA